MSRIGYGNDIVKDGLVLHLDAGNPQSYDGNSNVWRDLSGNGNHGTLVNGPAYVSSNNGCLSFDGVNDYTNLGSSYNLVKNSLNKMTFSTWVNFTTTQPGGGIFSLKRYNTESSYFDIMVNDNNSGNSAIGAIVTYHPNLIGSYSYHSTTTGYNNGVWHYLVVTVNVSTYSFYVDNVLIGSDTDGLSTLNSSSTAPATLGATTTTLIYPFLGKIGQTLFYSKVLTPSEMVQNYNATKSRYGL